MKKIFILAFASISLANAGNSLLLDYPQKINHPFSFANLIKLGGAIFLTHTAQSFKHKTNSGLHFNSATSDAKQTKLPLYGFNSEPIKNNLSFYITIARLVKEKLNNITNEEISQSLYKHFQIWNMMNPNRTWVDPIFQSVNSILIPEKSVEDIHLFIDQVEGNVNRNEYLGSAGEIIPYAYVEDFKQILQEDKLDVLHITTFGMALEFLTKAMLENNTIAQNFYINSEKNLKWFPHPNFIFLRTKWLTIKPIIFNSIFMNHANSTRSKFLSSLMKYNMFIDGAMFVNILEACILDFLNGHNSNANSGLKLIKESFCQAKKNPEKLKKWIDLYHLWNTVFVVGNLDNGLMIAIKLFIPVITNQNINLNNWTDVRLYSLYATGIYLLSGYRENAFHNLNLQIDNELIKLLGQASINSANNYSSFSVRNQTI